MNVRLRMYKSCYSNKGTTYAKALNLLSVKYSRLLLRLAIYQFYVHTWCSSTVLQCDSPWALG